MLHVLNADLTRSTIWFEWSLCPLTDMEFNFMNKKIFIFAFGRRIVLFTCSKWFSFSKKKKMCVCHGSFMLLFWKENKKEDENNREEEEEGKNTGPDTLLFSIIMISVSRVFLVHRFKLSLSPHSLKMKNDRKLKMPYDRIG